MAETLVRLTDSDFDCIYDEQYEKYGQLCDADDFRMFARRIEEAALKANGLFPDEIHDNEGGTNG